MPEIIYKKPHSLSDKPFHYCPGCSHGLVHRLVTEVIDELGIADNTIAVAPVGCAVTADEYFRVDTVQAAHGRAPAVATGIKRALPDRVVFTYQGDGDLAAIGTAETVHSAARGENITIIFINNTIYGVPHIKETKKAIKKAFEYQISGKGFSLVEVLCACPTNWGMSPTDAVKRITDEMIPYYPLGVYKEEVLK